MTTRSPGIDEAHAMAVAFGEPHWRAACVSKRVLVAGRGETKRASVVTTGGLLIACVEHYFGNAFSVQFDTQASATRYPHATQCLKLQNPVAIERCGSRERLCPWAILNPWLSVVLKNCAFAK